MNHLTQTQKLLSAITRLERVRTLATHNAPLAPPPGGEALAEVQQLTTESLLILHSLKGQIERAS